MNVNLDPNSPTFQSAAVSWALGRKPPPGKISMCFTCDKTPEGDKEYRRCAKCRTVAYCSRECQKKDWSRHKPVCFASNDQRDFVLKCFQRINMDPDFIVNLKLDLIDEFGDSLYQNSRMMRIFATSRLTLFWISPWSEIWYCLVFRTFLIPPSFLSRTRSARCGKHSATTWTD
ncbi:hypothetical protein GALMADRAFT_283214 [Galerina marginata CBS 339.88]|uniref:MYND-type domain-containing protein n=1 Tax=Galerina marginata (strain CBS 339.88) TaxID=685588 RepID=A0A067SK67_GALM3|nr:hypothetical protein GALMADRAFT_283214 [Galerina marginata CBS 339.88]